MHATQATRHLRLGGAARATGAAVVLCPSTEANLGDGVVGPARRGSATGVPLGPSAADSHVTRAWAEELRWLDYGQRLVLRERNVAAAASQPSTAARLFDLAQQAGARAAGFDSWGLRAGARADLLVVDADDAALLGVPGEQLLDALVFTSPVRPFRDVLVGGRWTVRERRHPADETIKTAFRLAMRQLWDNA